MLETRDRRGNRALHLALKFAHRNATAIVKALLVRFGRFSLQYLHGIDIFTVHLVRTLELVFVLVIRRAGSPFTTLWCRKTKRFCAFLFAEVDDHADTICIVQFLIDVVCCVFF